MVVKNNEPYMIGYNSVCEIEGAHSNMLMDIGIIKLDKGDSYTTNAGRERAILLIEGEVTYKWEGQSYTVKRTSCFDENPTVLHIAKDVAVDLVGEGPVELMYQAVDNDKTFESKLYKAEDTVTDIFGNGTLGNTSIRSVRTVIDDSIAPYSNLVIGEVINHPGKWSSYPPHDHNQPEVYHYRFLPEQGFGFSLIGEEAAKVEHKSTSCIQGDVVHPQCSAPGYAMYYIWMIPHAPKRWLKDRRFEEKHDWLNQEDPKIWPYEN